MFLKPEVTRDFATRVGHRFADLYTPELKPAVYRALIDLVETAERERFRQGESSILVVNLREQARADAAKKLVEVAADYWSAWGTYQAVLAVAAP